MDPITTIWLSCGLVCFFAGYIYAIVLGDNKLIIIGAFAGATFPLVATLAAIALLIGIVYLPYYAARYFIERNHRKELAMQQLDADLDKHIQETKELTR